MVLINTYVVIAGYLIAAWRLVPMAATLGGQAIRDQELPAEQLRSTAR
jgi:hypothetical protein